MEQPIIAIQNMGKQDFYKKFGKSTIYPKNTNDIIYRGVNAAMERIRFFNKFDLDKGNICEFIEQATTIFYMVSEKIKKLNSPLSEKEFL